ncbi:MAG: general stress protein [Ktedonobacteraceae bacterium]
MASEDEDKQAPLSNSEEGHEDSETIGNKYKEDHYQRIGKKGGTKLKETRGSEYYREIALKGGQANASKYDTNHFSKIGKKGGSVTKARQDPEFYRRIGRMGGIARRQKRTG